ncbi:MAG TPA: exodeoxyribonuclease VII large subunit [Candidatus Saccharimonadales bacterium]|nr:exodeoxyribonuclease VII large subunit [Candidatus Saccharimonadales bacterium]
MTETIWSVSDFVAVFNQTLEYAYPSITIVGELSNFRISRDRWVYFDLKDELSSVKFFGSVQQLSGPLEDGLMLQVRGTPRLHSLYGFSINIQYMSPVGAGSLKKAASLLEAQLTKEGLFEDSRKRSLPHPPATLGLIASIESAAYHDFIKIMNQRWVGVDVRVIDVQVQGEPAPAQLVNAIEYFNSHLSPVDALVITRGGGSVDDLAAFNVESVVRAVAASRIPTLVAIGHEVNVSLAELAADQRASTPSNAAELLFPDKHEVLSRLDSIKLQLTNLINVNLSITANQLLNFEQDLLTEWRQQRKIATTQLALRQQIIEALNPALALKRGYAIVRGANQQIIKSVRSLSKNDKVQIDWSDGSANAQVDSIRK